MYKIIFKKGLKEAELKAREILREQDSFYNRGGIMSQIRDASVYDRNSLTLADIEGVADMLSNMSPEQDIQPISDIEYVEPTISRETLMGAIDPADDLNTPTVWRETRRVGTPVIEIVEDEETQEQAQDFPF